MQQEEVVYLYLDDIIPNRFQPREVFDEQPLKELAVSIKEHGVIQPIIVRKVNDKYEIIAGERRYKASALAGLTKIPAIVRNLDDKETSKVALLENLQRKNLNPLEEARTYQKILEIDQMTQEELAKTMGKSQSSVANKIRLLSLPEEIQEALLKDQISERHARALLNVSDKAQQKELLNEVITKKISVRNLEEMIKGMKNDNQLNNNEPLLVPNNSEQINPNFVASSPLMPNFGDNSEAKEPLLINQNFNTQQELTNEKSNTENSLNQQDIQSEEQEEPKFINFGEINEDEDDSAEDTEEDSNILFSSPEVNAGTEVNINDLKQNTKDISSINESPSGVDLDSLLMVGNQQQNSVQNNNSGDFKFFSPAEEALKESETEEPEKSSGDYFKAPELINVDLPNDVSTFNTNNVPLSDTFNINLPANEQNGSININSNENNMNTAIDMIRETISKIEQTGIKVSKDEMNLENSYQVIIKLEK